MNHMTLAQQKTLYKRAKAAYEIGKPVMTDAEFDKLEDTIKARNPTWPELRKTGVVVQKKTKVSLVEYMPSLKKFYPEKVAPKIKADARYIDMDKLDGSAIQIVIDDGRVTQVATRGDGETGQDITYLAPHLKIPQRIAAKGRVVLRCEAVMKIRVFDKKYAPLKDKDGNPLYENPRNIVAGILNRKFDGTVDPALADIDVVVLGVYGKILTAGLALAASWGFKVVRSGVSKLSPSYLTNLLGERRNSSEYEMDGLVVAPINWQFGYADNEKPDETWAFKINSENDTHEAEVVDIIYQLSGGSRITPKVEIKPIRMGGVTVTYATVHNGQWMIDRKIGPGAKIKIVRSGGVIPKIVGVVKPAKKMKWPGIPYCMNGKNFMVDDSEGIDKATKKRIQVIRIHKWMTTMGIDLLGQKTIDAVFHAFPKVETYLDAWSVRQMRLKLVHAGLGEVTATKIVEQFKKVLDGKVITVKQLMVASQVFPEGIGERKLTMVEQGGISMMKMMRMVAVGTEDRLLDQLCEIHGYEETSARATIKGVQAFVEGPWQTYKKLLKTDGELPPTKVAKKVVGKLSGQFVSWTGYRSADEEAAVAAAGGEVIKFGARTTILLYKDDGKASTKVEMAEEKGMKVKTYKELGL